MLARLLLALLVPSRARPLVLDDLEEEFWARIASGDDVSGARRWYRREVLAGIGPALRMRRRMPWRGSRPSRPGRLTRLDAFSFSVSQAVRRISRSPGFAATTIATLGLAFAANATIFSMVNGILLRPLPYEDPDRLVVIKHAVAAFDVQDALQSTGTYFHYRDNAESFLDMGLYHRASVNLTGAGGDAEQITLIMATPSVFGTLGVTPLLGRLFTAADASPQGDTVVILTHALWRDRYGSDPSIVGGEVIVNGRAREVVGVLRPEFDFPDADAQMWMSSADIEPRSARFADLTYGSVARLRDGVAVSSAEAELRALAPGLGEAYGDISPEMIEQIGFVARVVPLREEIVGEVDDALWLLLGTVGLVLMIAAANVANLFLVRAEFRRREVAVRRALGAGRGRLFGYYLAESVVLCVLGGALGLALTSAGIRFLLVAGPDNMPRLQEVEIDAAVVAFAVVLAGGAALMFALIPVIRHRGMNLQAALRTASRSATPTPAMQRAGHGLVALQAAIAVVLLITAAILVQSFARLRAIDPGFDAAGVLSADFALPFKSYPDFESSARFFKTLQERIAELPEVVGVGGVGDLPLASPQFPPTAAALQAEGQAMTAETVPQTALLEHFLPGYFAAMKVPVLAGKLPVSGDRVDAGNPVVINRSLARRLFGEQPAVGKRFRRLDANPELIGPWLTVTAVVGDVLYWDITGAAEEVVYLPVLDRGVQPGFLPGTMTIVVRTSGSPANLAAPIRAIVRQLDPDMPVANVRPVHQVVDDATAQANFTMVLLVTAAAAAIFLGAVGVYGVVSYAVGQRTHEIGVRMALGASGAHIRAMVLRQGSGVLIVGLLGGLAGAVATSRLIASQLYGVSPTDPVAFIAAPIAVLAIAGLAVFAPARRASRIDPVRALGVD